jgi:hypothetical protein
MSVPAASLPLSPRRPVEIDAHVERLAMLLHKTLHDAVDCVVPKLQRRGRSPTAYRAGALRHKLFGRGPQLPAHHHGRRLRLKPEPAPKSAPAASVGASTA